MGHRVFVAAGVAAFSALAAGAEPGRAASVAGDALARYAAYVGKPAGLVSSYRVLPKETPAPGSPSAAPSAEEGPLEPSETTTYRRGALYHEIVRGSGVSTESGFNGHAYWSSNENRY